MLVMCPVSRKAASELLNSYPRWAYEYITTGSADEITLRENVAAFQRLKLLPPVLTGVSQADLSTAVGGRAEVYVDGGVRRGTDVLKALALGARAVLIGRPYAWALAADGEAGVRKVLDLFRQELVNVMIAAGCSRVGDVRRSLIAT
jgi:isopentenyl diphosphate isomerase/L-lactate dehydrogenase-like FMN-dependent dehydrogenase